MASYKDVIYRRSMQQANRYRNGQHIAISAELNRQQLRKRDPYNKALFDMGNSWFWAGKKLEEADESYRKNTNFIDGYELGIRQDKIKREMNAMGAQWFFLGFPLEDSKYHSNSDFVQAYNDAKNGLIDIFGEPSKTKTR